jgi:pimeloyl-ACP methyl ester carboxylesterase
VENHLRTHWLGIALLLLPLAAAATQPPAFTMTTEVLDIAGVPESVDVYRPAAGASAGVAIVAHGFTRSRIRHRNLGRALAKAGVTVVIPDLPNVMDHWGNGDAIVALVAALEAGTTDIPAPERARLVLIGTSAGGLATVLAAARLPGIAGWIGLDPVDRTGTGNDAAARLAAPAVVLLGSASTCNLFNSGRDIARAAPNLLRRMAIDGASHCDFEDPTTNLCRVLCGGSSPEAALRIREETVRATLELLRLAATGSESPLPDARVNEPAGPPEVLESPDPES